MSQLRNSPSSTFTIILKKNIIYYIKNFAGVAF